MYMSREYEAKEKLMIETIHTLKYYECKYFANNCQSHHEVQVE